MSDQSVSPLGRYPLFLEHLEQAKTDPIRMVQLKVFLRSIILGQDATDEMILDMGEVARKHWQLLLKKEAEGN